MKFYTRLVYTDQTVPKTDLYSSEAEASNSYQLLREGQKLKPCVNLSCVSWGKVKPSGRKEFEYTTY